MLIQGQISRENAEQPNGFLLLFILGEFLNKFSFEAPYNDLDLRFGHVKITIDRYEL
jgi:hypothetical protein